MADLDSGNRDYPSLYRLYMRCTRVPNRMFFTHIWHRSG